MNTSSRVFVIWISLALAVILSLAVAYVTFHILESSAEANLQGYKLGGGFAAFTFTFGLLFTMFNNLYRLFTTDQLEDYRRQIQELQMKLAKGAPCPSGYTLEIDERHKLAFSRPSDWEPFQGVLYNYVAKTKLADPLTANFNLILVNEKQLKILLGSKQDLAKIDEGKIDEIYRKQLEDIQKMTQGTMSKEYTTIDGNKSVKYINTYLATTDQAEKKVYVRQVGILTYVPRLISLYVITCTDDSEDFLNTSEIFNTVISSIRFL
jgi:hypothetical protein